MTLRVAIDHGPLLDAPTGVGRYTRELTRALTAAGVDVRPFAVALRGSGAGIARWRYPARAVQASWLRFGRPSIDRLVGEVDVVHGTNFVLPVSQAPGVVTIHDLSFLRDDAFAGRERWGRLVPWSIDRARRVITITNTMKAEIVDHYGVDPDKVLVTHLGIAPVFFGAAPLSDTTLARFGITRPFVLAAGTLEPRKNLVRLLDAWRSLDREREGWKLVLAGPPGWGPNLPAAPDTVLTGWVGDETLPGLLAAADLFAFPSLYEGFGLPPLEAMAAGTACVVGDYTAARELLGDAAAIVDAQSTDAIRSRLAELMGDANQRRSIALAGKARAASFTWEQTAAATLETYLAAAEMSD